MAVKAVFFDMGETITNESRFWAELGRLAGVEPHVIWAALGAVIERRGHHDDVFSLLDVQYPGDDVVDWDAADFYPDALPCIAALKEAGYFVGLAGNYGRDPRFEPFFREHVAGIDFIGAALTFGVEKPSPEFFAELVEAAGVEPAQIAYVGDRVDNDVVPAADTGMVAVFIRRGPWAHIQSSWPEAARATIRIDSLAELPEALAGV